VRSREDEVIDFGRLNEIGSTELIRELSVIFVEDMVMRLDAIGSARSGPSRAVFERCAHAVKGACGNFGARRMAMLAERIEQSPDPTDDLTALLLAELRSEFDRVRAALRSRNLPG
jgi:HPt (histidine-containing phosphotransfer) domain-containing protein